MQRKQQTHKAHAYQHPRAWLMHISIVTLGAALRCMDIIFIGMYGWTVFCLIADHRRANSFQRSHRERLRAALARKKELDARPRYYEEPDHFFW